MILGDMTDPTPTKNQRTTLCKRSDRSRIRINPEIWIRFPAEILALAEVCTL